jgi:Zn-dependent protease with chaperone function
MQRRNLLAPLIALAIFQSSESAFAQSKPKQQIDRYAEARKELPEDLYPVYRMLERIIQTNKTENAVGITVRSTSPEECFAITGNKELCAIVGDLPDVQAKDSMVAWAIQVVSSTNSLPNASADGGSLIRIGKSLVNGLSSKPEALACVVAHELAHIKEDHIKKISVKGNELDEKTSTKIASAIKNAHNAQKSAQTLAAIGMVLNAAGSGLHAGMGNYAMANQANMNNLYISLSLQAELAAGAGEYARYISANYATLQSNAPRSLESMKGLEGLGASYVKRTKQDIDQYLNEHRVELMGFSREQESEADKKAIEYVAKAGINPKSCLDVLDLLHKTTADKTTSSTDSHPGEKERRINMEKEIEGLPPTLKNRHMMQQEKLPMLPYVFDKNTQIVRIMPQGTVGMKEGKNSKSSSVDALLGN